MGKMKYPDEVGLAEATSREDFTNRLKTYYEVATDLELIVALLADRHRMLEVSSLDTALDGLLCDLILEYRPHSLTKEANNTAVIQTSINKTFQRALRLALVDMKVVLPRPSGHQVKSG